MAKVSTLMHFLLELGCEGNSFLDWVLGDFEHGFGFFLTDCINMPQLDASFSEADAMSSSYPLVFLYFVSTISDNSRLQVAPSIKSHNLLCQAMALC